MPISFNSTHMALLVIAVVSVTAMLTSTPLEQTAPILAAVGAYAAIRERSRIKGEDEKRSGERMESLEEVVG